MSATLAKAFPSMQFVSIQALIEHACNVCSQPAVDSVEIERAKADSRYPNRPAVIITGNDWTAYAGGANGVWFYIHEAEHAPVNDGIGAHHAWNHPGRFGF